MKRATMAQTTVTRLCQQSGFESLFWDEPSSHPLRLLNPPDSAMKRKTVERHIKMLVTTQENENEFFWQEAAPSNLLAFLYSITHGEDELALENAHKQLNLTLQKFPNNLNAILGRISIAEKQEEKDVARKIISDQYDKLKEDGKEMAKQKNICHGEIAYACSFIGPDFYIQAIDRYESLLDPDSEIWTTKDELSGYIVRWHYYLAYTYNRMLNKGNKKQLAEKLDTKDTRTIFNKISELYKTVIASDDTFYRGKAMIDLVDAHKKCETSGSYQEIRFPYDCTPAEFVKDAMDKAPKDPHVWERCGRHYRQKARSKKDFDETVAIFDHVLKLHPTRHVAWHHKGLTCKALWHITGKYDEADLYKNTARMGHKKQFRKNNHVHASTKYSVQTQARHAEAASATAVKYQNHSSFVSEPHPDGCNLDSMHSQSIPADEQATTNMPDIVLDTRKTPTPQTAPKELPTLRPWNHQRQLEDVPRQMKKSDYFDRLRTSNPPAKPNRSRTYLEQAKDCFKKAKDITKGTCSPYVIDLARALISLKSFDEAEKEFIAANRLACTMNDNDATYLYEQWALLRHSRAIVRDASSDKDRGQMKDVARLYRQAILSAVRARYRSRIAFYKLRDLLSEELKHDGDNPALLMEHNVLCKSVEKYSEYKDVLVEALKQDDETREIAWEMIRLLHGRSHPHDAAIAFMYLTALHEANQLNLEDSTATPNAHESSKLLLLDVVLRLVSEGDQTNAEAGQTFGEIFRWFVGTRRISDYIKVDLDSPKNDVDICILAPSKATPGVSTVLAVLRDVCGIAVLTAFSGESTCDIIPGVPTSEGLRAVVAKSQAVVVVEDSTDKENWNMLFSVLEELMSIKKVKVCFVADEKTDRSNTEQRYIQRWPSFTLTESTDVMQLAYGILKAMFC